MQKYKIIKRTSIAFLVIIIIQISIALFTNTDFINVSIAGTYGNFEYEINSETNTIKITKYSGNEEEVTIPNMIEGKSVTYLQAADINRNNTCADDIDLLKMVRILVGYE